MSSYTVKLESEQIAHSPVFIDPELDRARQEMLVAVPGGFNAPETIEERRALINSFLAQNPINENVSREDSFVEGTGGSPDIRFRIYRPLASLKSHGALFVIHGGGLVMGGIEVDDANASFLCENLGVITIALDYRLAPENPYPSALDDCYAVSQWIFSNVNDLKIDRKKIVVFGGSAGGGLAIALSLLLRDRGEPNFALVMTPYPMLDDRNATDSSHKILDLGVWDRKANIESWNWYLGENFDAGNLSSYAAPAREKNLKNLPPTFIDVGTADLFRDEDREFVNQLRQDGNNCEFHEYIGAYHASELFAPDAAISREMWSKRLDALRKALS